MPIHDWTLVDAGVFHHFHQHWIIAITDVLNQRLLPREYYALAEQQGAGYEPDVLTLKASGASELTDDDEPLARRPAPQADDERAPGNGVIVAEPRVHITAETDLEFYRRKQSVVAVRHVSGDRIVAVVEIVSKGNKSGRKPFEDFVRKAAELLSHQIHLLILDLQPPTARDPQGIHGAIWDEVAGQGYTQPVDKPLTLAAYDAGAGVRAYVVSVGVADVLVDMPLFLGPRQHVELPLEETYQVAYESVPRRWRAVLEPS